MITVFSTPMNYVQGPGALQELPKYMKHFGKKGLIIGSSSALSQWGDDLKKALSDKELIIEDFGGKESSKVQIQRLVDLGNQEKIDFVVGFGGGKPQDVAKGVCFKMDYIPIAIIPTIAASDAPTPAVSVIYKEDGSFDEYWLYDKHVDLILIDTKMIALAPARYLVAGMGDALATKFEGEACIASGKPAVTGAYVTETAKAIYELCYDLLLEYGATAKESVENQVVTPALEKIVEVNTLLSGLGCENNGVAAAHAIHDGFTVLEEVHHLLHGEKVAFCTVAHLVLEGRSPVLINEVIEFCYDVGLPITLEEMGVTEGIPEKIRKVSESVSEWIGNHPFEVTTDKVYSSIIMADSMGKKYKSKLNR